MKKIFFLLSLLPLCVSAQSNHFDKAIDEIERKPSSYQKSLKSKQRVFYNQYGVALYKPNYILPLNYNKSIDQAPLDSIPSTVKSLKNTEFNAQISFYLQLFKDIVRDASLYFGYTQKMHWQLYTSSPFFRELNYEPEIFIQKPLFKNVYIAAGLNHESNGRGGESERSWNRATSELQFSYERLFISTKAWVLIFKNSSSKLHNPDIQRYLGNARLLVAYHWKNVTLTAMSRNNIQSKFKRGAHQLTLSVNIHRNYRAYFKYFQGYGQNLIEYNHRNTVYGVGIVLNDWL